jgi:NAD(P)H dehydrogenase (quinone)
VLINGAFVGDLHRRRTRFTSAISAATHAGVSRIVLASFPEANTCPIPEATDYIEAEAALRAAGPDWTIVREAVSMANPIAREVAWATRFGQLRAPTAGALCVPAAITDLAEATARVLADPPGNATVYEFSGPRAVDWTELAELASELAGQTIHFEPTDDAGFETVLAEAGVPAWHAPGWRNFHAAFRAGWGSHSYPDLGAVLGRAPVDTREAIRRRIPTLAN